MIAAAFYRDGLAAVFTFGAVIAAQAFDFTQSSVIMFGIVANVVSGLFTFLSGHLEDRIGPLKIIKFSLSGMIGASLAVFLLAGYGQMAFWISGLILVIFVGPTQSSSRTYLLSLVPKGKEGEIFGLYATTGRTVSFLAPLGFSLFILWGSLLTQRPESQTQHWGILGIVVILSLGLFLLLKLVKDPRASDPHKVI
jgi:UMF1 family MFS transporter